MREPDRINPWWQPDDESGLSEPARPEHTTREIPARRSSDRRLDESSRPPRRDGDEEV